MAKTTTYPELNQSTILDAGTADIRAFAAAAAGLEFGEDAGRDWMIAEVFAALEWDAYRPEDDATHVVIKLPRTKDDKHPYIGGFNGKMFTIQRDKEVEIPVTYYNTMVESAIRRYKIETIGERGEVEEGSPASRRLPLGALDMQVIRFLKKGEKKAAPTPKTKPKATEATTGE